MKINMPCPICNTFNKIDIEEHKSINYNCKNNHDCKAFLAMPIYPLFFQYGLTSYDEGYYFESFISLYKAYETFISEFIISVLYDSTGDHIEPNILSLNVENISNSRKLIKQKFSTSNKLDIVFETLYFTILKKEPPVFKRTLITDRNLFVHADKIITDKDCELLASEIKRFVRKVEIDLITNNINIGNVATHEYAFLQIKDGEKTESLATDELDLGTGSMDENNDFQFILANSKEYNQK